MTSRRPSALPDIADDDFRRRLSPLARAVVPGSAATLPAEPAAESASSNSVGVDRANAGGGEGGDSRDSGYPDIRLKGPTPSGRADSAHSEADKQLLSERIAAVTHMEEVRAARGPKKGVEFLLPQRIVSALKIAAAQDGTSMTVKVLEALRTAGYPITDADFVDLRKLPKR